MRDRHGDYDDLFKRLLAGRGFDFITYPVLDGALPNCATDADGWLITGSKFGAYEDHDWIPQLEVFLRDTFSQGVPIVGVCFGHQILAQALGGKVEKFAGGWAVGPAEYESQQGIDRIMAWHQDQVVELPKGAEVLSSSEFCQYAMLGYGDNALTIQPHPEFTAEFMADLIACRRDVLPSHIADQAAASLSVDLTSARFAEIFEAFFKTARAKTHA